MRRRNWRVAVVGLVLMVLAAAFFFWMSLLTTAPRINDPVAMMQTVGTVSGAVGAIGLAMLVFGLIGKKA